MNKKQYNNIIDWTLKHENSSQTDDSVSTARAIFNNMGVALPQGNCAEIADTLKSDDYMGWKSCTAEEAQAAANKGTAAIAVSDDELIIVAAEDEEEPITGAASLMTLSNTVNVSANMRYYTYSNTTTYDQFVEIPQDGDIGTIITYMGYHRITSPSSNQYRLKTHAKNNGRYSIANPQYFALIDNRIAIATKPCIGNVLNVAVGDYVIVDFLTSSGSLITYNCIIGDIKGADAPNIWGHNDGKGVVEIIYHDYSPPAGYNSCINNPWGSGRVIRIAKVGKYGYY